MGVANFDAFYRKNASFYGDRPALSLRYFLDKFEVRGGGRGLDLACGQGRNAFYLASKGYSMFGIDESSEAIAKLGELADTQRLDVSGKVVNLTELEIESQQYDIIIAYTALDHVSADEGERLAREMMKGLAPGGYLFAAVFMVDDPGCCGKGGGVSETAAYIRHYYQPGELREQFRQLEPLAYQEEFALDISHSWPHHHSMARLFARKPLH
ncbi:bifunctional 2-polyprenyl-6-hydroxyphenol methylase/3-demethylubiquinol 3-O-methyltransferase UbiG [Chromobacterium sp. IIBBL 290-4]|uniref:class I SAM-dependent methyltransferase n=1 Tax=Chromobacterium sp. IIBBL 290-4 TaxID=2953890 RepID=UPI0020B82370|nr:class I SAM-dependent methyltransferase [Chromobacterium sp. IIBBL 290-4]UTH72675.1 class I SAM-dependent methyltransferase [Chromobacterium sp. IIBBL 290-4]